MGDDADTEPEPLRLKRRGPPKAIARSSSIEPVALRIRNANDVDPAIDAFSSARNVKMSAELVTVPDERNRGAQERGPSVEGKRRL